MPTIFKNRTVKVNGLYNHYKIAVLVTLYAFQYWYHFPGLVSSELQRLACVSRGYVSARMPVFCSATPHNKSGKLMKRHYCNRRPVIWNNRAVMRYSLSDYGKTWDENKLPRSIFNEYVVALSPIWEAYLNEKNS